jgi:DHA3 family tetracycline resistance protein-like MFS transporter
MVSGPLHNSWLNQSIDEPGVRATIFSVSGQADALGQVMGGPVVGFVGKIFSVSAALSSSALLLTPAPVMISILETRKK